MAMNARHSGFAQHFPVGRRLGPGGWGFLLVAGPQRLHVGVMEDPPFFFCNHAPWLPYTESLGLATRALSDHPICSVGPTSAPITAFEQHAPPPPAPKKFPLPESTGQPTNKTPERQRSFARPDNLGQAHRYTWSTWTFCVATAPSGDGESCVLGGVPLSASKIRLRFRSASFRFCRNTSFICCSLTNPWGLRNQSGHDKPTWRRILPRCLCCPGRLGFQGQTT